MNWLLRQIKKLGHMVLAAALFFSLCLAWTFALYWFNPWIKAEPDHWPDSRPIAVTGAEHGVTRVILHRDLDEEIAQDDSLVPWPASVTGTGREGRALTSWKVVAGKPWHYEVTWDDGDHRLESRYRLEGDKPVLVESRGRDPGIALIGFLLAILTLIVWKLIAWWRQRKSGKQAMRVSAK